MQIIVIGILAITLAVHKSSACDNPSSKQEDNYGTHWLALLKPLMDQASELHNQLESECKPTEVTTGRLLEAISGLQQQLVDHDDINKVRFEIIEHLLENNTVLQKQYILENISGLQIKLDSNEKKLEARLENIERIVIDQQNKINEITRASLIVQAVENGFEKVGCKYFYYGKDVLSWWEALNKCKELGAHLVSFQNEEEMTAVIHKLNADHFWTDVNDNNKKGEYISSTTGHKAPFIKWLRNEPNNNDGNERCLEIKYYDLTYGYNDLECRLEKNYVCELANIL